MRSFLLSISVFAFLLAPVAAAQTYTPKDIRIEGAPAYAADDLSAVAGLKRGGTITTDDIQAALQRFVDTGLFARTRYDVNDQVLVLTLTPVDARQMLPLQYGNIVWWKPEELAALLHARVPLFNGMVPVNGSVLDAVKQTLTAMLAEKGITARIESMANSAGPGAPVTALTLMMTSPEVKIGQVRFDGAPADAKARLENVRAKFSGEDFNVSATQQALVNGVERAYRDDGFLDVSVDAVTAGAPRANGAAGFLVDIAATVQGGERYRVSSAEIHGAVPVVDGELQKLLHIKSGDIASAVEVREAQNRLSGLYVERGYLDADAKLDMKKDAAAHQVAYVLTMMPGEPYRVASVGISGFTADQEAAFNRRFHMAANALFDKTFFDAVDALNQDRAFKGLRIGRMVRQDARQHTVAVTLTGGRPAVR